MLHERKTPDLQTRDLTTRALSLRSDTLDEETRSVEAVLATERVTTVFDWARLELIDESLRMSGAQFGGQVPMLETHQRWSLDGVLGSIRELKVEGSKLIGRLFFAEGDERAENAWRKVRQGHITDVSIGYRVEKGGFRDVLPGQAVMIDGKEVKAGTRVLRITTTWTLREGSLVPIGADDAAKIRDDTGQEPRKETSTMSKAMRAYLGTIGLRSKADKDEAQNFYDALSESAKIKATNATREEPPADADPTPESEPKREEPKASDPVKPTSQSPDGDADATRAADAADVAVANERERVNAVKLAARGQDGKLMVPEDLVLKAESEGWDIARAQAAYLQVIRDRPEPVRAPAGHSHSHDAMCTERVLTAAMAHRAGQQIIDPNASNEKKREQERIAEQADRYSDMSMIDVMREGLRLSGISVPHNRNEMMRAAFSTSTMTNIFTATANAAVMGGYAEAGDTTAPFCRVTELPDYKTNERILLGKGANLKQLPRGGTADHAAYSDGKEEYKAFRFGQMFTVDEMDIVDDRFGALLDRPREIGNAAGRVRPDMVYYILNANAALADSIALFNSSHSNYQSGGAMTTTKVQDALILMMKQTQDGAVLNIIPTFMLIPADLIFSTEIIMNSALRLPTATTGDKNPLLGRGISIISEPRLGVAGSTDPITGTVQAGSATAWYLLASPSQAPTIEVGYVRGTNRAPTMRSFILDRGQYGIGWDVSLSLGAKALDYRGMFKDAGT